MTLYEDPVLEAVLEMERRVDEKADALRERGRTLRREIRKEVLESLQEERSRLDERRQRLRAAEKVARGDGHLGRLMRVMAEHRQEIVARAEELRRRGNDEAAEELMGLWGHYVRSLHRTGYDMPALQEVLDQIDRGHP